jgi:hypothetical protein
MKTNDLNVIAVAAWINANAKVRPVSVMMEQKGGNSSLISFMNGNKNRRTVVVSFSEEVASQIGINVDTLKEGYENHIKINIDMFEATGIANRIRLVETTDEAFATENYFRPKKAGVNGSQMLTPDGEPIYFKYEWIEARKDGSSDDVTLAYIPVKDMAIDSMLKEASVSSLKQAASEVF